VTALGALGPAQDAVTALTAESVNEFTAARELIDDLAEKYPILTLALNRFRVQLDEAQASLQAFNAEAARVDLARLMGEPVDPVREYMRGLRQAVADESVLFEDALPLLQTAALFGLTGEAAEALASSLAPIGVVLTR